MPQSIGRIDGPVVPLLPTGRRLLVKPHRTPEFKGTIILPDSVKSTIPTTGTILKLGFDLTPEGGCHLEEGDQIVYSKYGGVEFKFDDQEVRLIIHEDDVLAVVEGDIIIKEDKN